ncbi:hypothetical protein GCM10023083_68010 [Streptomyces phyllanthi]
MSGPDTRARPERGACVSGPGVRRGARLGVREAPEAGPGACPVRAQGERPDRAYEGVIRIGRVTRSISHEYIRAGSSTVQQGTGKAPFKTEGGEGQGDGAQQCAGGPEAAGGTGRR